MRAVDREVGGRGGHEPDLVQLGVAQRQAELAELADAGEVGAGRDRAGERAGEVEDLVGSGQRVGRHHLVDSIEAMNACWRFIRPMSELARGACAGARRRAPRRRRGVWVAGVEVDVVRRVVDGRGDADLDAADRVDHVLEAGEVDDEVVVDVDAGEPPRPAATVQAGPPTRERVVPQHVGRRPGRSCRRRVQSGRSTSVSRGIEMPYADFRSVGDVQQDRRCPSRRRPPRRRCRSPSQSRVSVPITRMLSALVRLVGCLRLRATWWTIAGTASMLPSRWL